MTLIQRLLCLVTLCFCLQGAVPTPQEHFGYTPGDDFKLFGYAELATYFEKLAKSSDRIKLEEFGRSSEGRPLYIAYISDPANLSDLDKYRQISRRLALGQGTAEDARRLSTEGKAIVWIDSGMHANEVAPPQHSPLLAYRMLTDNSAEVERIRKNVILLQLPCINPDGMQMMADWYKQNLGTPYEVAPLPKLYQKYAGHDNNRDWFMMNLKETQAIARLLFEQWFPQIVYNQHQMGPLGARFFVPPYAEPLNPNIPGAVMEGINLIGTAIRERLALEGKTGVQSYTGFDAWWNGGLRTAPAFHNMHGILTEAAHYAYATPRVFKASELPDRLPSGVPNKEPSVFQQKPWPGGKWALSDSVSYILIADLAILDLAASRPSQFLYKAWDMARNNIEQGRKGKPYAYILSTDQADASSAAELMLRLKAGGLEVRKAQTAFQANGKSYPAGTLLLPAAQAFRGYLVDLLEPQKYPEIRTGQTGPTKRPYDLAGWTLSYQMGVSFDRVEEPFEVSAEPVDSLPKPTATLDHRQNASFQTMSDLLAKGTSIRWAADGSILAKGQAASDQWNAGKWEIRAPRVGVYEPWTANMDTGWTQWTLDYFKVSHTALHNDDLKRGGLRANYDVILLGSQSMAQMMHGYRAGEPQGARGGLQESPDPKSLQRPEYEGGMTLEGAANLAAFVRAGGTLIALDSATEMPLQLFPLGVRGLLGGGGEAGWYCPGSLLRVDIDNTNPLAFGMPKEVIVTSTGGQAFAVTRLPEFNKGEMEAKAVAWYAKKDLLASGWVSGERAVLGKAALVEARLGAGRVVLVGFRPQFRGQSFGSFKLLLNAIYLSAAKTL